MTDDGDFDLKCLIDLQRVVLSKKIGKSTGVVARRKPQPSPEDCRTILDFTIKAEIESVNDKPVEHEVKGKKYHLECEPIKVEIHELKHRVDDFEVWAHAITSSIVVPKVCPTDKVKLIPIKINVSGSMEAEARLRQSKILIKGEAINRKNKKMAVPKLNLNLNEKNELTFKILIEDSSSDIGATKPQFRFVVSEQGNGWGMIYPAEQGDDGNVVVRLPSTENFLEKTNYRGKLEVILGNHYFVPTEVDIEFIRPLKVEAVVITNKNSSTLREEKAQKKPTQTSVSVSTVEVKNRKGIKETSEPVKKSASQSVNKQSKPKKRSWEDLTKAEQQKIIAHLKEKKLRELKKQKLLEEKRNKAKQQAEMKKEARFKNQLKDLISSSLLDE